jgi:hypothetical protein
MLTDSYIDSYTSPKERKRTNFLHFKYANPILTINYEKLQKPKLNEPLPEFHENNGNKDVSLEVQQEDVISINDISIPQPNMSINYNQNENENETCHYPFKVEPSSRTLIFDTKGFS